MNRNSFGMTKSEIIVQMNDFTSGNGDSEERQVEDLFGASPASEKLPEEDQAADAVFGQPEAGEEADPFGPREDNKMKQDEH